VTWYRTHGYQFFVLTDHNFLTNIDGPECDARR